MGEFFASLQTLEWVYLALFCVSLIYALFLAVFGFGHGFGHGDVDLGHGDVHMDLGHDVHLGHDVAVDLGHDVPVDLGHAADLHVDGADLAGHVGDHALHAHGDLDADDHHVLPLNPIVIATFLAGFGGFGILGTRLFGLGHGMSLLVAMLVGLLLGAGMFFLYRWLMAMNGVSSAAGWAELRGLPAYVLTPIPEKGLGEIVYVARGARYNAPARTIDGRGIPRGESVTVLDVVDSIAIVDLRYID